MGYGGSIKTKELPGQHQNLIAQTQNIYVSAVSCWEVAMLHQRQKIELTEPMQDWLPIALRDITCLPLNEAIAIQSAQFEFHHRGDPADRFIIATALAHDCQLMSFDTKFVVIIQTPLS